MPFQKWGARQEQVGDCNWQVSTVHCSAHRQQGVLCLESEVRRREAKPSALGPRGHLRSSHGTCRRGPRVKKSLTLPSVWTRHMSTTTTTNHLRHHAQQRLHHIAAEWPADPLRPKIQLKTFLAALSEHPALSPRAVAATHALHQNQVSSHVSGLSSDSTAVNHHLEIFRFLFRKRY
jgi:hypothetical protein